jgi:pSer/pThr/pTyr-binding forkhead associated (FHA) protein
MPAHDATQSALELAVFAAGGVRRYPLPAQGTISIGRAEGSDIRIDDSSISRRHAVIYLGVPPRIEDLRSANGTRLRREHGAGSTTKRIAAQLEPGKAVEFSIGDAISLGSVLLVVRWREPGARVGDSEGRGEPIVLDEAMQRLYALAERGVAQAPVDRT